MREEILNWWEQAKRDLLTAENSFTSADYYASVFWCQQAVEKGLKALYIQKNNSLPLKIHDLVELCRLVNAPDEIIMVAGKLSVAYTFSRYPGAAPSMPDDYYTKNKAREHLKWAQEVLTWIQKQITL
ncbi:MAG: hypothetical protein RL557_468 [archaeon]|jgi:HEPN domain-containing protein